MQEHVLPAEAEYHAQVQNIPDWRDWKQPAVMETLKAKARAAGLWNLFLPDQRSMVPGLPTSNTRRWRRSLAARRLLPRFSIATLPTPATWKCW